MKIERRSKAVDKVYKRRDRIEMPDFQREEVWPMSKKRLLIDSILKGWHLPKFYFRKVDDGMYECVDGQQRLVAIWEFFDNVLELDDATARRVGGSRYSELLDEISDSFDDFEIDIEEIEDASDEELEELFRRLQLGTPLNTAEKLNAIQGEMRDFCHDMAAKPFFRQKTALKNTRYTHFETVVRWVCAEARGILPQMRYPQLESLLRENRSFSRRSDTATRVSGALDFLDTVFEGKCDVIRSRANTLSVCMLAARVYAHGLIGATEAAVFQDFVRVFFSQLAAEVERGVRATDSELIRYQLAVTSGSTAGDSIRSRVEILTKRLATFHPSFTSLLGMYGGAADEATRNLSDLAAAVREGVYAANRKYAAVHGQDLFKLTNESSAALTVVGQACSDSASYAGLVDALYMLVYEGTGCCKRLPSPPPRFALHVKCLRTMERHDVDHGDPRDVSKKRLRAAEVFETYAGKKSPQECGPAEFLAAQVRMLMALREFVEGLP